MKTNGTSEPTKLEVLVETWKITFLSTPRHFKPLSLCWRHHLHHSTASSFAEGQQQHLLARRLINWLIRRLRCKLIDWSSCGWSFLYLEPWGAKLWRSTVICHVQHTGEDGGEMKSCGFITETWGACMEEVSAKMGTGGMQREQWEHGDKGAEDEGKGEDTLVLVERERYRLTRKRKLERSVGKSRATTTFWRSCPHTRRQERQRGALDYYDKLSHLVGRY